MEKKKVLFIFNTLGIGGAEKIEAFVANECLRSGYDVEAISLQKSDIGVDIDSRIPVSFMDYKKTTYSKFFTLFALRQAIKKANPDIICVFLADVTRIVTLATICMKIPIIASERGDPSVFGDRRKKYEKAYSRCRKVVFQTKIAQNMYNLPKGKSTVIANPCFLKGNEDPQEYKESPRVILSAGRYCKQKRFDLLIDAFSIVVKKHPEYRLKIYGSGQDKHLLEKQIQDNDLSNKAFLCDYVPNVFYTEGLPEVFVLSSDYEGIPNVLMEALMLGIPCVSTDCSPGGARLLLGENEERGLLSPTNDVEALANNINIIIENSELANAFHHKGKTIIDLFNPDIISKQWIEVFNDVSVESHNSL